jgi:hypothetical protein
VSIRGENVELTNYKIYAILLAQALYPFVEFC